MPRIIGNLEKLETTIQHDGRGEEHTRMKEAEDESHRIREEARQEAEAGRAEIVHEAWEAAKRQQRQQRAEAVQAARRAYLTVREELLDEVWQQAEQQLRHLIEDAEEYTAALRRLTWQAIQALGAGRRRLVADSRGHALLTKQILQAWSQEASDEFGATVTLERDDEPLDTWGGLVVTDETQRRRFDATFATRLAIARDELRDSVFQQMVQNS